MTVRGGTNIENTDAEGSDKGTVKRMKLMPCELIVMIEGELLLMLILFG